MSITLAGEKGAGKSAVAEVLAKKLGYEKYGVGEAKRDLAKGMGITIAEFDHLSTKDPEKYHLMFDKQTASLASRSDVVVDGNIAFHFLPNSFKVFMKANPNVRGQRIMDAKRKSEASYATWQEALQASEKRIAFFKENMMELYDCDILDTENYDLIIDSSNLTIIQVADAIIKKYHQL